MKREQLIDNSETAELSTHAVSFLLAGLILSIGIIFFSVRIYCDNKTEPVIVLQNKINPNTAPICSLIRLVHIGRVRAAAIDSYRIQYEDAFISCADMNKVKGIGNVISGDICSYLIFD
ncbi:MAG: hypothetical protein WCZ89_03615 [Phycisphaerae bacterium]